jgi:hypothetical protein
MFKDFKNIEEIILDISHVDIDDDGYEILDEFIKNKKSIAYVVNQKKGNHWYYYFRRYFRTNLWRYRR